MLDGLLLDAKPGLQIYKYYENATIVPSSESNHWLRSVVTVLRLFTFETNIQRALTSEKTLVASQIRLNELWCPGRYYKPA